MQRLRRRPRRCPGPALEEADGRQRERRLHQRLQLHRELRATYVRAYEGIGSFLRNSYVSNCALSSYSICPYLCTSEEHEDRGDRPGAPPRLGPREQLAAGGRGQHVRVRSRRGGIDELIINQAYMLSVMMLAVMITFMIMIILMLIIPL